MNNLELHLASVGWGNATRARPCIIWWHGRLCPAVTLDSECYVKAERSFWPEGRRREVCSGIPCFGINLTVLPRFMDVIRACSLEHDLDVLPDREETEIGEKGINLSGELQKFLCQMHFAYYLSSRRTEGAAVVFFAVNHLTYHPKGSSVASTRCILSFRHYLDG